MKRYELGRRLVGLSLIATSALGATACSSSEVGHPRRSASAAGCRHDGLLTAAVFTGSSKTGGLEATFTGQCVELKDIADQPNGQYLRPGENIDIRCSTPLPEHDYGIFSPQGAQGYGELAPGVIRQLKLSLHSSPHALEVC